MCVFKISFVKMVFIFEIVLFLAFQVEYMWIPLAIKSLNMKCL